MSATKEPPIKSSTAESEVYQEQMEGITAPPATPVDASPTDVAESPEHKRNDPVSNRPISDRSLPKFDPKAAAEKDEQSPSTTQKKETDSKQNIPPELNIPSSTEHDTSSTLKSDFNKTIKLSNANGHTGSSEERPNMLSTQLTVGITEIEEQAPTKIDAVKDPHHNLVIDLKDIKSTTDKDSAAIFTDGNTTAEPLKPPHQAMAIQAPSKEKKEEETQSMPDSKLNQIGQSQTIAQGQLKPATNEATADEQPCPPKINSPDMKGQTVPLNREEESLPEITSGDAENEEITVKGSKEISREHEQAPNNGTHKGERDYGDKEPISVDKPAVEEEAVVQVKEQSNITQGVDKNVEAAIVSTIEQLPGTRGADSDTPAFQVQAGKVTTEMFPEANKQMADVAITPTPGSTAGAMATSENAQGIKPNTMQIYATEGRSEGKRAEGSEEKLKQSKETNLVDELAKNMQSADANLETKSKVADSESDHIKEPATGTTQAEVPSDNNVEMEIDSPDQEDKIEAKQPASEIIEDADDVLVSKKMASFGAKKIIGEENTSNEDVIMTDEIAPKLHAGANRKSSRIEDISVTVKNSRKSSRKGANSRLLRGRSASNNGMAGSNSDTTIRQEPIGQAPVQMVRSHNSNEQPGSLSEKTTAVLYDGGPRPVMEANGLVMRAGNAIFVTEDQLDETKTSRLVDKKVVPFERLTFADLRTYNRDQLRAYCFAYGMDRRKKTEMEADMATYLSYWNRGNHAFALSEYIPTSSRHLDREEFKTNRGPSVNHSAGSLCGNSGNTAVGDASRRVGTRTPLTSNVSKDRASAINPTASAPGSIGVSGNPQSSMATPSLGNTNRSTRPGSTPSNFPRGFGTSYKQRVHARQASAKFKAAYNGAGDTIVNVVENAAAYFEGKDAPEVVSDQNKSFERYQFNVDLLAEILDGPMGENTKKDNEYFSATNGGTDQNAEHDVQEKISSGPSTAETPDVLLNIAKHVTSKKRNLHEAELDSFEAKLKRVEKEAKHTERTNMRLFQKLERSESPEQVEAVRREFEKEFGMPLDFGSRPVVRRRIDKSLPPMVMPDDQCRILRFTFL